MGTDNRNNPAFRLPEEDETQQFVANSEFPEQQQRVVDAGQVPVQAVAAPVVPAPDTSQADELVKKFYSAQVPVPKLDQNRLDRIQKMGRINNITSGVNVLGDILSLGMGANVRKAAPDTMTPELVRQYQATLDKYKGDQDAYDLRNFQKIREDAGLGLSRADKKTAEDLANKRMEAQIAMADSKNEMAARKYLMDQGYKGKQLELQLLKLKDQSAMGWAKVGIAQKKLDEVDSKPFKPIEVYDDYGKPVKITQAEWSGLYENAIKDGKFTQGNLKAMLAPYENNPDAGRMQIASDYYRWKQSQRMATGSPAASPTYIWRPGENPEVPHNQPVGTVTGPSKEEMQKNAQEQKPEYSNLQF